MRKVIQHSGPRVFVFALAFCAAGISANADPITYAITVDLSFLHPGSSYSGSVTVPTALLLGQSTPITLLSSPTTQYLPGSLVETLSIGSGPVGFNSVFIAPAVFTDSSSGLQYDLIVNGAAHCDVSTNPNGVPCQTGGQLIGGNANGGVTAYTVSAAPAAVPEPGYSLALLAISFIAIIFRQRGAVFEPLRRRRSGA